MARRLMDNGRHADAITALGSKGVHDISPEIVEALASKHPDAVPPPAGPLAPGSLQVSADDIEAALKSFKRGTGRGPSGLRQEFYADLLKTPLKEVLLSSTAAFATTVASGRLPRSISPFFGAANLIPLVKKDNGVRPIAVGEIIRRAVAKCAMKSVKDKLDGMFVPFQMGVGIPHGLESIIHGAAAYIEANGNSTELTTLQIDFSNAFNLVSRERMFAEVRKLCPSLSAYVEWLYSQRGELYLSGNILYSAQLGFNKIRFYSPWN
jgi:hypothetical protein